MTSLTAILADARKLATPSARQEANLRKTAEKVLGRVRASSSVFGEVRGVELGGSFAKGTWLPRGGVDLDIFVRIAGDTESSRFETVGLTVGREAVRGYPYGKKYAQHPYTEAVVDGVKVNIVPCYDVEPGRWKSAADRSLFHVAFVKRVMGRREKAEVRVLKLFMKTVGVYGAEIQNGGFSGYATEVIVHFNKSFEGALSYFSQLRFEGGNFSLKDPVDPGRELATAISKETLARMVLASRAFLEAPELAYFRRVRRRTRRALTRRLFCVRFDHKTLSEDTLWGELKKSARQLARYVQEQGFVIARFAAVSNDSDKSAIVLLPVHEHLPDIVERVGPSVDRAEEARRFILKNGERAELVWVEEDGRLHLLQKRRYTGLGDLLEAVCAGEIEGIGASRDIARSIRKTGRVLVGTGITEERKRERWFADGVDSIVADTIGADTG